MNAAELHRLARLLREIALEATADPGERPVSAGHLAVAEDVAHHDGTSIGEIAQRTGLAQSLVSRVVAQMRDAGVFLTAAHPQDRRRVVVRVDPKARSGLFAERGSRSIEMAIAAARPHLSELEVQRVVAVLDELATLFDR